MVRQQQFVLLLYRHTKCSFKQTGSTAPRPSKRQVKGEKESGGATMPIRREDFLLLRDLTAVGFRHCRAVQKIGKTL
jgi:hypothetical protein